MSLADHYQTTACPVCTQHVMVRDRKVHGHLRYVDGGGWESGLSHDMIRCEGEGRDVDPINVRTPLG